MPDRQPDSVPALLREDWLVKHITIQALLPGLSPAEIKDLKRRMREAQKRRRFWYRMVRQEVRATLARWEAERPRKPVQLELPL